MVYSVDILMGKCSSSAVVEAVGCLAGIVLVVVGNGSFDAVRIVMEPVGSSAVLVLRIAMAVEEEVEPVGSSAALVL
jgi:hypothetical protein